MMRLRQLLIVLLLMAVWSAWAQTGKQPLYREGQVIVKFKDTTELVENGMSPARGKNMKSGNTLLDNLLQQIGVKEIRPLMTFTGKKVQVRKRKYFPKQDASASISNDLSNLCFLKFDTVHSVKDVVAQLQSLDNVDYAEPNYIRNIVTPKQTKKAIYQDDLYDASNNWTQGPLYCINMPFLWEQPIIHEERPVIAILDKGVDVNHEDLKDNIVAGWNSYAENEDVSDITGHGTHCAGIAAAVGNNGIGITGTNPDALIMPIKIADNDGVIDDATLIKGINWAVAHGADILSMSLGSYDYSEALRSVLYAAASQHVILVASAGNDALPVQDYPSFPAAFPFVIGVQSVSHAINSYQELDYFSNYDDDGAFFSYTNPDYNYELRAPGSAIVSTLPNNNYDYMDGTSQACPRVAGAISRLLQCRDFDSYEELLTTLVETGDKCIDMKAAYEYQGSTDVFSRTIENVQVTFKKNGNGTIQLGDGMSPCTSDQLPAVITFHRTVAGYLLNTIGENAFLNMQFQRFDIPNDISTIAQSAFSGSNVDTLYLVNSAPPQCAASAFTEEMYENCKVIVPNDAFETYQNDAVWSRFKFLQKRYETFEVELDGKMVTFRVLSKEEKTVQIGAGEGENYRAVSTEATGELTIPNEVNGYRVVRVGEAAFESCSQLTAINLPDEVDSIGGSAFLGCAGLTSFSVPQNVKTIPKMGFAYCSYLHQVTLPDGVLVISDDAFNCCNHLQKITFPESLCFIGWCSFKCTDLRDLYIPKNLFIDADAFFNTPHLATITVDKDNPYYESPEGSNALISIYTARKALMLGTGQTIVPDDIDTFGMDAISGNVDLTEINIPRTVTHINPQSIVGCPNLKTITVMRKKPLEIPDNAFVDFPSLEQYQNMILRVPKGCKEIYQKAEGWKQFGTIEEMDGGILGDVNKDGTVTEDDVTALIDLAGKMPCAQDYDTYTADMDNDDLMTVSDVVLLINQLNGSTQSEDIHGDVDVQIYLNGEDNRTLIQDRVYEVRLYLYHPSNVTASMVNIRLPEGLAFEPYDDGKYIHTDYDFPEATHIVRSNPYVPLFPHPHDCYDMPIVIASPNNQLIPEGGMNLTFQVRIIGNFREDSGICCDDPMFVSPSDYIHPCYPCYFFRGEGLNGFRYIDYVLGDVTGNGSVDVQDATLTVNYILGKENSDEYYYSMADMNNDGEIDVFDVTAILNIILNNGGNPSSARSLARQNEAWESIYLIADGNELMFGINNPERFTSFQFDVEMPQGVDLLDVEWNSNTNHLLQFAKNGDNRYRVVALSLASKPLPAFDDALLRLHLSERGEVGVDNVLFVTPDGKATCFNGATTGMTTGVMGMSNTMGEQIFDISGRRLNTKPEQLSKGVYIINNKKVVIK